jgi:hypothetical protein
VIASHDRVRGEGIGSVVVVRFNEAGQAARIVFLSHDAAEALHEATETR